MKFLAQSPTPVDIKKDYAFGEIESLGQSIQLLVIPAFSIATLAVVIYFLVGVIKLLISGGDKNAVASARAMITHAIIGFILLILMFFIFQFIPQWFGFQRLNIITNF